MRPHPPAPKHAQVFATLRDEILAGRWTDGERLPSEAELVRRFSLSRITVGRALRDLQTAGLVTRRAGAGTFVRRAPTPSHYARLSFGLLIPDLGETDIFEPICQGMMASPLASQHALLWGSTAGRGATEGGARTPPLPSARLRHSSPAPRGNAMPLPVDGVPSGREPQARGEDAWHLAQHYIERGVDGVFFAPVELPPTPGDVNHRILRALDAAAIPVVLLDRTVGAYPDSPSHDLVGIDNRRAGYVMTDHLLRLGARRVLFVRPPDSAPTVDAREAGYREAMYAWDAPSERSDAVRLDPDDVEGVRALLDTRHPDGIVCSNDRTAGRLMHTLRRLGVDVPGSVRLVGIDDVEFASLLPVPLTTLRQPTRQIGEIALRVMLDRVARSDLPPRDTRLPCTLVVRESCGAAGPPHPGAGEADANRS